MRPQEQNAEAMSALHFTSLPPSIVHCLALVLPIEAVQRILSGLQINLHFLSLVKYGTVPVATENFLVKRTLTVLALRPELAEDLLVVVDLSELIHVDLLLPSRTILAKWGVTPPRSGLGDWRATAHTLQCFHGKHHNASSFCSGCWLTHCASVITSQKSLRVGDDGLEDAGERIRELIGEVVFGVNREVILQHIHGVFTLFIRWRIFSCLNYNISHAIAHIGSSSGVSLLHTHG
mmetsp:Transcript_23775/g.44147  ORF Transcript_23775/g.44147 Transcript_23775/m.44147 type:complete len:235 (-) Transcript_23775:246-950(-)